MYALYVFWGRSPKTVPTCAQRFPEASGHKWARLGTYDVPTYGQRCPLTSAHKCARLGTSEHVWAPMTCPLVPRRAQRCQEVADSGHFLKTFSALGLLFSTLNMSGGFDHKKHKVNTYKERALSTACTNGKMETKREIAPNNELVPIPEFRIQVFF